MAPSPGTSPIRNASPGFAPPTALPGTAGTDGATGVPIPAATPGTFVCGAPTGVGAGIPITFAKQSSQYNTSRTGRTHAGHIGLPQLRQNPVASTSGCTAHFIESSSQTLRGPVTLPPALPIGPPLRSRDSVASVAPVCDRPIVPDPFPVRAWATIAPASP